MEKEVKDSAVNKGMSMEELSKQFLDSGGFVAKKVGTASEILKEMFSESKVNFLSFPACIISTGTRGLIKDLIKDRKFQIVMTTCGTLDHDFARIWKPYFHGSFQDDDVQLHKEKKHRLGNIRIPEESYGGIIEEKLQPILEDIYKEKKHLSTHEFVWEIGKRLDGEERKEESIIYWCWKNQVPMIIPGITDGAFGLQIAMFLQDHSDFQVDVWKDEKWLMERMFDKVKTGALMIGGGISKHHVIWWNQWCDGLDYVVYITTAPEWDGSLSGARTSEGISWGKVNEQARHITVEGDATVLLPLIAGPLL